jgi:hypothetical protein
VRGYTDGNTERENRTGGKDGRPERGRTGRNKGRNEEGNEGRNEGRNEEGKLRKVDRTGKTARSSPTDNPQQRIQNGRKKRKPQAKNHEKENGLMFCSLFLNSLDSCSFIVSSF